MAPLARALEFFGADGALLSKGNFDVRERVTEYVAFFATASPSAFMMSSMARPSIV